MTIYFKVKRWADFQHYKDRNPPWIKLHNQLLDNYDFECLPDASKAHLLCIWMLASRTNNKMPYDPLWVAKKIGATCKVDLQVLVKANFLQLLHDASIPLHKQEHSDTINVPLEEKRRGEAETEDTIDRFDEFWELYDKKTGLKKCKVKWKRLRKKDIKLIFKCLPAYVSGTPDKQFRMNPLTWLNGENWNDEVVIKSTGELNWDSTGWS